MLFGCIDNQIALKGSWMFEVYDTFVRIIFIMLKTIQLGKITVLLF